MSLRSIVKGACVSFMDDTSAIRVDAEFFGSDDSKMFGCRYTPGEAEATTGVVICCAIQSEFVKNYRREVLLARSLAAHGYAVQRFHYRGTGNSDGEDGSATFESMRDDALGATELLREETGVAQLAFVGTRWGALVAAGAATHFEGAPLVLWEPVIDARRYFKEVLRFRLMHVLKEGSQTSSDALLDEMRETGSLDILGNSIHRKLYESSIERSLSGELGKAPRSVFLAQTNGNQQLRGEYSVLVNQCGELGFPIDTQVIANRETWWFAGEHWQSEEANDSTSALVEGTKDWLDNQLRTEA